MKSAAQVLKEGEAVCAFPAGAMPSTGHTSVNRAKYTGAYGTPLGRGMP